MEAPRPNVRIAYSPRHMRKRRFSWEVPASMIEGRGTPGYRRPADDLGRNSDFPALAAVTDSSPPPSMREKASYHRKRLVALGSVILVSISIPALALTLIFAR